MVRDDHNDQIYKTKQGKWKAVRHEIADRHEAGQPILVGTISVEVSEMLSDELTRQGVDHVVLNAKPEHAQREGETIAQAGRIGAVTIATNMAGRGVDIKLGGDPEIMAAARSRRRACIPEDESYERGAGGVPAGFTEECDAEGERVREAGGLFICGTERHESRRIDNQLRGRSGRQGDPGESRFFLSAEDDLMRLFAGDRIYKILDRLGPVDEQGEEYPLEAKILTADRERAEEGRAAELPDPQARPRVRRRDERAAPRGLQVPARDPRGPRHVRGRPRGDQRGRSRGSSRSTRWARCSRTGTSRARGPGRASSGRSGRSREHRRRPLRSRGDRDVLAEDALDAYERREEELGDELMRYLERQILLQIIDNRWREHLYEMDYLREGIHLRGFAQIDPLVAYKNEGFKMFRELMNSIWEEFARVIFHVEVTVEPADFEPEPRGARQELSYAAAGPTSRPRWSEAAAGRGGAGRSRGGRRRRRRRRGDGGGNGGTSENPETEVKADREKIGRNDPCWCGSGKKYKKCHGA